MAHAALVRGRDACNESVRGEGESFRLSDRCEDALNGVGVRRLDHVDDTAVNLGKEAIKCSWRNTVFRELSQRLSTVKLTPRTVKMFSQGGVG